MVSHLPQRWWQMAWQAEPNDPHAMRRWTDVTHMVASVREVGRGRQYELAESQAGEPPVLFNDPDEYLNPANTSSPYWPYVQPYRELLGQCMWPNGGTGNLINPDMWMPNDITPLDPSFEAYANGAAAPATLTAVGGVAATVTTTNPQQGTKSLTYTVAGTAARQGVSWDVPCVPGQQHTSSAYMRQSSASTQWLLVGDQNLLWDDFGRSASSGWGTSDSGSAYTTTGGSASDYSVGGGVGKHSCGTVNARRRTFAGTDFVDVDATVVITCPVLAAGGSSDSIQAGLVARWTDTSNNYRATISFIVPNAGTPTFGLVSVDIAKVVAGVTTSLASATSSVYSYVAGTQMRLRLQVAGDTVRARMWPAARLEPSTWDVSATDTALTGPGAVGCHSFLSSGVTNTLPVVVTFDQLTVAGSTASTTTTTSGAYVRLSKTFTASQPVHTVTVCTKGTATAGTVNVDAIQHEPGGTANSFTTTGPNIFPILRDGVERWPRSNQPDTAGFAGQCDTVAVDGFAALAAITLDLDYPAAVMALQPNYFWRLDAGSGASTGLETSGNNGPPLVPYDSKYGPGVMPEFGTPMDIPGAAGATGVRFTPNDDPLPTSTPGTVLACGRTPTTPGIAWPRAFNSTSWALSMACWVRLTPTDPAINHLILLPSVGLTTSNPTIFYLLMTLSGNALAFSHSPVNGADVSCGDVTPIGDGEPHLLVATMTQVSGGDTVLKLYVDGVLSATGTATTASLGGMFTTPMTALGVGGGWTGGFTPNGSVSHVSLWERELSAAEVTTLWTAGGLGHAGELSGTRITRRLAAGRYAGQTRISAGSTTMQPSTAGVIDGLSDAQATTKAEDGTLWVAPDGALVFEGRQQRWLRLTPRGVFGEDQTGGEIPYLDGVIFDFDPNFVAANVRVSRINGTTAVGGSQDQIDTTARRYYPRSYKEDSDFETDVLAQYKADWVFASHKAPLLRVSTLTIDPSSNPTLWTKALSIEVGQRWTVKRRAKAANAGAGLTQSEDFFVEAVRHNEIDPETGLWTISLLMSPIGLVTNSPGVTFQPWILENATYGVLDSTTVLGW